MTSPFTAETFESAIPHATAARAKAVVDRAHDRGMSLASAESCTGGMLAALLTDIRGRSHVFECGFVSYSDRAKTDLLGVDAAILATDGAVSKAAAIAMATGALDRSRADIAVSITGFAGPGAPDDEEGLVHFACVVRDGRCNHREEHFGPIGRPGVRIAALDVALAMLDEVLSL
ncbi:CinA family protein [Tsuneonella amylolytica]|uniref:CinA family protein n=1 Tax=Tsuneonella amylolytica TaxID=2338327 RepID=UPI000EA91A1B|nr:nicotinamide-nucleotide amidohydrolase family protein [Tsuneonella amylolytica]